MRIFEDTSMPKAKVHARWNPDLCFPLLLAALGVLFFADPLFSSKNFFFRDILNFHYPLRHVLVESYARWEFPLWNPFIYLGQPMLANPNYMAFYPTNLLHLFLPFNYAFKLHFILHPLAAGIGLYFFQRRLQLTPVAALAGALAYEFGGTLLSFLNLYNIVPAVALLPWIGWAFLGAVETGRLSRVLLLAVVLSVQVVAFEPLMFLCEIYLLAGLALYYWLGAEDRRRALGRLLQCGLSGGALAAGLAAVQILPTLELLPRSGRGSGFDLQEVTLWSVHPLDLLNTLVPNLFGNLYTIGLSTSWGEAIHNGREGYLVSFFLGSSTLLLAALGLTSPRRRLVGLLAGGAAFSLLLALGKFNPVYAWLWKHIPLLQLGRFPSKYFLLTALCIAVLAGLGLEAVFLADSRSSRSRRVQNGIAAVGLLVGIGFVAYWLVWPRYTAVLQRWIRFFVEPELADTKDYAGILVELSRSALSSGVILVVSGALVAAVRLWRKPMLLGALMVLVLAAELMPTNLRLSPLIADPEVSFVPEVNKFIREKGPPEAFRVVPPTLLRPIPKTWVHLPNRSSGWLTLFFRMSGQPFFGIMNGIQYSLDRTVDYLDTRESKDLWRACRQLPTADAITLLTKLNSPMLLLMSDLQDERMRYLRSFDTRSDQKLNLYWLENTISRAYFVTGAERAVSRQDAFNRFIQPAFPFGTTVILEGPQVRESAGERGAGRAQILRYTSGEVVCEVEARLAGYLVLLDTYYPGWKASVDGAETQILQANYAFRAVPVPAGKHVVRFHFRPASFYLGLAISLLAVALTAVLAWFSFRRQSRSDLTPDR